MEKKGVVTFGEITIDFDRLELRCSSRIVPATAQEFRRLRFLVENPYSVFSRPELMSAAWPERERVSGRTVDNVIAHLRRKLEKDPANPVYLQTVYGVGYRFAPFPLRDDARTSWCWGWTGDGRPEMRPPVAQHRPKRVKRTILNR